jgi:enterochelin esterase-like enzyme
LSDISGWVVWGHPLSSLLVVLVVHDGTMYREQVGLAPPCSVAWLEPRDRHADYAASPAYADRLVHTVLPVLGRRRPVVGLGASLGALALLHAHRAYPRSFDALFLQSGSFFTPELDPQEADRFALFGQVSAFVAAVVRNDAPVRPVPIVLTCGLDEENLANNRNMAAALRGQGYPVQVVEVPGGHDHDTWRRCLEPALGTLLRALPLPA